MKLAILIPTYNESANIERLLTEIGQAVQGLPELRVEAVVLDDSSPDGTASFAKEVSGRVEDDNYSVTVLIREKKEGLGKAYIWGFKSLLSRKDRPDYVLQMDADLSHNPCYISDFVKAAGAGADLVVGTRYIAGGGTPDWSWHRRFLSQGGNWYARLFLDRRITDYTGGFNMYRAALLDKLALDKIASRGYGFQLEFKTKALRQGARVAEVPIVFHDREHGKSKMPASTMLDSLLLVLKLRFAKGD